MTAQAQKVVKALEMLRQERFQLFSEQNELGVFGIVKSQSNSELVYACMLGCDGTYSCCTQNLNPCGGLRGSPCKHIFLLIIGLVQAEQINPGALWEQLTVSEHQKPDLNKELMARLFLKYKGAESGEIDWRPTETLPEDCYSF